MPACYASCSFYSPRADLKCRRFKQGLVRVFARNDPRVRGMSLSFRKWGKLEATGSPVPVAPARIETLNFVDGLVHRSFDVLPPLHRLPYMLASRWDARKAALFTSAGRRWVADAFVLECVLMGDGAATLTVSIKSKQPANRFFQRHIEIYPGYNKTEIKIQDISGLIDMSQDNLFQIEPLGAWNDRELIITVADFVTFRLDKEETNPVKVLSADVETPQSGKKCKCVVWDLDNTLWQGILVEDGFDKLKLNQNAVAAIKELDRRGILHSLASKNNPADAMAALEKFGLSEYFLAPQISWGPKSMAIKAIAQSLNLGVDSFAFVDDQPFERAEVQATHPGVSIYSDQDIDLLCASPEFNVPATAEAARRRQMYREEESRQAILSESGSEFVQFLKSCHLRLAISDITAGNIDRVFELAQRTNQLNYAGKRLPMADIQALLTSTALSGFVLSCSDRFGDYGVIGFAVVDVVTFTVENFFMSCRVQSKKVDNAFFGWLQTLAKQKGVDRLKVRFTPTAKNGPSLQALKDMQFEPSEDLGYYLSPGGDHLVDKDIVDVSDLTAARAVEEANGTQ
ncbi:HAD-IIIC family phosphatase [Rhodoblastus sp.]|uniref:HAD-IIIC family phosphatase n=1 Tax=Rhodoblastus sp. TaxID=1962975 RepID=UPI003F9BF6FF